METIRRHVGALPRERSLEWIVSVGGAGDTLAASILASLVQDPREFEDPEPLKETVEDARVAAALTLKNEYVVSPSPPRSAWTEFLGIRCGSIAGTPDLFRSNSDFFPRFLHEEHIMHISTRPFTLIGRRRHFLDGHYYSLANNYGG